MGRGWRSALIGALAVCVLAVTMWMHAVTTVRRAGFSTEEDLLYLPNAELLRVLSLGHRELLADLVWIRAVVYAGGTLAKRGKMVWLDRYLDTIMTLDPRFRKPYQWAGVITMYNGHTITNEMVMQSNHYLEKAVDRFPDDWEFPFMLGANYLHELRTQDPKERALWDARAANYIERAALLQGGPPWLPILAATLTSKQGKLDLAVRHLEAALASTDDDNARQGIRNKLANLKGYAQAEAFEQERSSIVSKWKASLPYTPFNFYVLVGERPVPKPFAEQFGGPSVAGSR